MRQRERDDRDQDRHRDPQHGIGKARADEIGDRECAALAHQRPHEQPGERRPDQQAEREIEQRHALRQRHETRGREPGDQCGRGKAGIDCRHAPPRCIKARDAHRVEQRAEHGEADQRHDGPEHGDEPLRHADAVEQHEQRAAERQKRAAERGAPVDTGALLAEFAGHLLPHQSCRISLAASRSA